MNYRSEIDGLRALAVLPVILFHAGFNWFSGGFIGVDVFFVISGYLITRIILDDIAQGKFSILRFYERRARRILPALFFVIAVCTPFAFAWMLPAQYEDFSRSVIAVVLFIANLYFWQQSGYFAAEASEKPMLHTWSLGVEEQYYVFFPLLLLLLWRFGRRPTYLVVIVITCTSLVMCEIASHIMPSANFFLLPTRAWELLAGSLCAISHLQQVPKKHNLLSLLGLGLILFAIFAYSEHMRLPSLYTLAPVVGTALILLYGAQGTWVARVLSLRAVVGIGLISYSAYLWHHPIFAFAHITNFTTPTPITMLLLAALALLMATVSWWLVEQPFRNKQHRFYVKSRIALPLAIVLATIIMAFGAWGHFTKGHLESWKQNAPDAQLRAYTLMDAERQRDFSYDNGACVFNLNMLDDEHAKRIAACSEKHGAGIAVIGDSHAMNLFHVLNHSRGEHPFMVGFAQGMCRPYEQIAGCNYEPLRELLEKTPGLFSHIIYEQAGWELLVDAHGKDIEQGELSGLALDAPVPDMQPNHLHIKTVAQYLDALSNYATVTWLGVRIEPEITESTIVHLGCDYPFTLRPNQGETFKRIDAAIADELASTKVRFVSQIDALQFNMRNDFMNCDVTYWKDRNHFSAAGEKRFGERITLDSLTGKP